MTEVAVLGAGNGGLAAAADLTLRDHEVRLYNRTAPSLEAVRERGGIRTVGALGDHLVEVQLATTSLDEAIDGVDAIVMVLPAIAHGAVAGALAKRIGDGVPVILNPGHMCGSLHVRRIFQAACKRVRLAEFGTLTYICRKLDPGTVDVYLCAGKVPFATVPDDDRLAGLTLELFPGSRRSDEPLEVWLWDVNMVLHPPGMILGAARIEATAGEYTYYVEGVTDSVAATMRALDDERLAVAHAYGVEVLPLEGAMAVLGTADADAAQAGDLAGSVRGGEANASIKAPSRLDHRYLHEDVPFGLVPLVVLARAAGVVTPVADALISLGETITGRSYRAEGLNKRILGLDGAGRDEVLTITKGGW